MLEILYFIGIFPIQTLLESILSLFYILTQSYGLSLILLSFSIQIFLFKLLSFFEHKSQAFNALKQSVNNKREEFKRVFKGAELMSYTQILYKQRGFHPLFALFSLGGLALQIPLFIALIILVNEAEFLKGVGFLWINDLSKPDMIMSMSSMGLNTQEFHTFTLFQHPIAFHLLPFMMCMLSLGSVWIYAQDRGQVIQGIGISLLFFVLLYNMPSALVLYWSSNMLFTLLKGLWWRVRESKQRENNEQEGVENQKENREKKEVQYQEGRKHNHQSIDVSQEGLPSTSKPQSQFSKVWRNIFTPHNKLKAGEYKAYKHISILAIVNICFMICVFSPFAVYSSDVSQFDPTQTYQTLGALFGVFILSSLLLIYLTSFFYKSRLLKLGAYGVSVILLIGVVYTFVLTGDYGVMDHFVLQKLNFANYELRVQKITQAFFTFSGSALFVFIFLRYLKMIFGVSLITLVILSFINLYEISQNRQMYLSPIQKQEDNKSINVGVNELSDTKALSVRINGQSTQPYEKELFSYSKTQKNIVVIVLDMFSGSHMKAILEQFPELKTKLDGFVWFDNAVATASSTIPTIATLIGGEYYSVYNMNERKDNLANSITKAFGEMGDNFIRNGYDVGYFMSASIKTPEDIRAYNQNIFVMQNRGLYNNYYLRNKDDLLQKMEKFMQKGYGNIVRLLSVGLFRFAPELFFRGRIYNDGLWFLSEEDWEIWMFTVNQTSSMYAFSTLHNTESQKPTFKYLHTLMTHTPFNAYYDRGKCTYFVEKSVWDEYPNKQKMYYRTDQDRREMFQHYDSELCALSYLNDYIQWLKSEGIYDNTQIFVVSDHGGNDFIDLPTFLAVADHRPDALLLFKNFGERGELQRDSRLMANYDISSIFCENLPNGCPNVPANILKNYPQNRSIITTVPFSPSLIHHKPNEWKLNYIYRVKDNLYKEQNWQDITQEVKEGKLKFSGRNH